MNEKLRARAVTMALTGESLFEAGDPVIVDLSRTPAKRRAGWEYIHGHKGVFKHYLPDTDAAVVDFPQNFFALLRSNGNHHCIHVDGIHIVTQILRLDIEGAE